MYASKNFIYQYLCFKKAQETKEMERGGDTKEPVISFGGVQILEHSCDTNYRKSISFYSTKCSITQFT
jgi:hypothetical protein